MGTEKGRRSPYEATTCYACGRAGGGLLRIGGVCRDYHDYYRTEHHDHDDYYGGTEMIIDDWQ
ncbi:hypothetical protein GMST_42870 [Geomonas silvestris]|uniref:Uncharacterized protein n=1 Tax=Geomonas silvestris TaxID=2740184 RepID=A0A6V8MPW4_9BACT|nr:hypothetical protein GMST_42870 [Geomonas silvestris]